MEVISAKAFIKLLNDPPEPDFWIRGKEVNGIVSIDASNYSRKLPISIIECTFTGSLNFSKVDIGEGIEFDDCTFQNLIFEGTIAQTINGQEIGAENILIKNCTINESLNFHSNCDLKGGVYVGDSIVGRLFVRNFASSNGSFVFYRSEVTEDHNTTIIDNSVLRLDVSLSESTFKSPIRIKNIQCSSCIFEKSTLNRDFYITNSKLKGSLVFNNSTFNETVVISAVSMESYLNIYNSTFKDLTEVNSVQGEIWGFPKKIHISSSNFENEITISDHKFPENKNDLVEEIVIQCSNNLKGIIKLVDIYAKEILLKGRNVNSSIFLNKIKTERLYFIDFANFSTLQISQLLTLSAIDSKFNDGASEIKIENSYLGKALLFDIGFNTFKAIKIWNSHISEILTASIYWFKPGDLNKSSPSFVSMNRNKVNQEIYRQLKQAMINQNNFIDASKFRRHEMKFYSKVLKNESWKEHFFDKIILFTNRSNNYGTNWGKPLGLGILFTLIFYFLLVISFTNLSWNPAQNKTDVQNTLKIFGDNFGFYFQLFNPTRVLQKILTDYNLSAFTHFLDVLHRIGLTYFIYQTVTAFRKLGK